MAYRCSKPSCSHEYHRDHYQPGLHCICGALIQQDLSVRLGIYKDRGLVEERAYPPNTYLEVGRISSSSTHIPDLDLTPFLDGQKTVSKSHLSILLQESGQARVALKSQKNQILINRQKMMPGDRAQVFNIPLEIKVAPKLIIRLEQG